ncbi:hypothetical protein [Bartonella sp. HY406]|uniref:hypothetical protein n=1 Tax=Bartonella sp. HY406 TaxID=2979331 RepID=UPI0021CA9B6D|nr:hypothetical protein [Bartonella sp. HY406]UXN02790.1 hypothetical protein N6B01_09955 [Bartonella sp. HY406]
MKENIANIINNMLKWSALDFIDYGNNNPFVHCDKDLLKFIKENNCVDFARNAHLIGRFEGTNKTYYVFFEEDICNCIKIVVPIDAVFQDQYDENGGSIGSHKIILHLKDFDSEFFVLDNNVLILKNADSANIYGFHKNYQKDIAFQKQIYGG